ncbi:MAG: histidine kinase [Acidobacteriia bacterium]|nr:histidine kinase [Terriglobia bacterium]MBZ5550959.1 histidine kinase [Terriglobia bacterium]
MTDELDSLVKQMYQRGILYREAVSEFQKVFVASALHEYRGNLSHAAPKLGMHRNTLTRVIAQLGLDVSAFRSPRRRPPASVTAAERKTNARR